MKRSILAVFLLAIVAEAVLAQDIPTSPGWFNRYGRWSVSLQGGGNMWMNNFDKQDITGGGNAVIRYAISRYFSLGVMGGFDVLHSKDITIPAGDGVVHPYVQANGYSGDLVGYFHLNAGKPVAPYLYAGIGQLHYKRIFAKDVYWPKDEVYTSIHIPVGLGLEMAMSKHVAVSLEAGARILDNWTDNFSGGTETFLGTDLYPTARLGLSFFFGSSDDDDNDGDMLTNGYEKEIGTDINKADTDGDGLSDYEEVAKLKTNPTKADSDADGLSDGDEIVKYKTDPLKADSDGDGLSDGDEVATYRTNPLKADTDGDGLRDNDEVLKYKTDPLKIDTDTDGLSDSDEVIKHKTDPLKADTDGGTVNDATEVARGSNPLDPTDDVPKPKLVAEVGKAIVLEGIVFKSGKSTIEPESEPTLMDAFNALKENPNVAVEIRGYTDNVGKVAANKKLSLRRAEAVRSWLVKQGIDSMRIGVKGYGPENPIADNSTPEGRQKNRRIEFFRTK